MRFFAYIPCLSFLLALAFLAEPIAGSKFKRRGYVAKPKKKLARVHGSEEDAEVEPKKRRLGGKGKGSTSPDDDFYKYSCEYCGQGNDSALGGECFSKDVSVVVNGRGLVKMDKLQVGDKVLTHDGVFQSVYAFAHRDPDHKADFLKIHSDNAQPLELTHDHLVYLADKENPVRARSVRVGDVLKPAIGSGMLSTILKIETVQKTGIYAPLTLGGTLVANGVVASSYISVQDAPATDNISQSTLSDEYVIFQGSKVQIPIISHQQYVDLVIAPYRLFCRAAGSRACDTTKGARDGMPLYVRLGLALTRLLSDQSTKFHPIYIATSVALTLPFWLFERAVFLDHGLINFAYLTVVLLTALTWIAFKKNRIRLVAKKMKSV